MSEDSSASRAAYMAAEAAKYPATFNLAPLVEIGQRVAADAASKGAERRPTFAPSIPFDDPKDGAGTGARIWAAFTSPKYRGGIQLQSFRVRLGKASNGKAIAGLRPILDQPGMFRLAARYAVKGGRETVESFQARQDVCDRRTEELTNRLRSLEADLVSSGASSAVRAHALAAGLGFCVLCGKGLVDPVSVQRQVGPECWGQVRRLFGGEAADPAEDIASLFALEEAGQ